MKVSQAVRILCWCCLFKGSLCNMFAVGVEGVMSGAAGGKFRENRYTNTVSCVFLRCGGIRVLQWKEERVVGCLGQNFYKK